MFAEFPCMHICCVEQRVVVPGIIKAGQLDLVLPAVA